MTETLLYFPHHNLRVLSLEWLKNPPAVLFHELLLFSSAFLCVVFDVLFYFVDSTMYFQVVLLISISISHTLSFCVPWGVHSWVRSCVILTLSCILFIYVLFYLSLFVSSPAARLHFKNYITNTPSDFLSLTLCDFYVCTGPEHYSPHKYFERVFLYTEQEKTGTGSQLMRAWH